MTARFLVRRLGGVALTLAVVATFTFLLTFILPADPARIIVGPRGTDEQIALVRHRLGLDESVPVQYGRYLGDLARLDLGYSYVYERQVRDIVTERLPWTALLAGAAFLVEVLVGIPLGLYLAARAGGVADRIALGWALFQIALPSFWFGLVLLYLFAFKLTIFPLGGNDLPEALVLPALTLGLPGAAWYSRIMRDTSIDLMHGDFVHALRAKGMPPRSIMFKHVFRTALSPVLTMTAIDLGFFLGGAVLVESVFSWPGLGYTALQALRAGDIPLIMATVLVGSTFVLVMNVVADVARAAVDPRVRLA
jgi:peptide/nickel transport system permease protein